MNNKNIRKNLTLLVLICSIILVSFIGTYAFFVSNVNNKNQEILGEAGTLALTFADGNPGINQALEFGSSIEKTFSIENTGSLEAIAKINFENLINTYIDGSLTYSLSYTEIEDGDYTYLISNKNVPRSTEPSTHTLLDGLTIPINTKYFCKLTITLNYLNDTDQTEDLNAIFSANFSLKEGTKPGLERSLVVLNIHAKEDSPDFNKLSPEPIYEMNTVSEGTINSPSTYVTYASSYKFDPMTGKFTLINPQVAHYYSSYTTLKGKYVAYSGGSSTNALQASTNLNILYKVNSASTSSKLNTTQYRGTLKEYNDKETGVFSIQDEEGLSYYYRGAVENNYLKFGKWSTSTYRGYHTNNTNYQDYFSLEECENDSTYNNNCSISPNAGKDMYWRIIRVNGNGSIRIIYDGTEVYQNGTSNMNRLIGTNKWSSNNYAYGFMYGSNLMTSKEEAQQNEVDSDVKIKLDNWYRANFLNTDYEDNISDEIFCNDRSIPGKDKTGWSNDSGLGYGHNTTLYGPFNRLFINSSTTTNHNFINRNDPEPILTCPQENDKFTVSKEKGNGKLTYPIGLISVDEAFIAGALFDVNLYPNNKFYLHKGQKYFTMSPAGYGLNGSKSHIFQIESNGSLAYNYTSGIAPVINLSAEYVSTMIGDGTMENPFRNK